MARLTILRRRRSELAWCVMTLDLEGRFDDADRLAPELEAVQDAIESLLARRAGPRRGAA